MDIKDFAEHFLQAENSAWKGGNFDELHQIESPDIIIHMPPTPDINGFDGHKQYILNARDSISDLKQEWDYVTGDGNIAIFNYKSSGKAKVEMPAMSIPAGATISNDAMFVLRREKDKVSEIWIKNTMTLQ